MGAWLILGVLVIEVALLTAADRILYGSWVSPSVLLGCPYTIIVTAVFLLGPPLDFLPLHAESLLIWVVALPVFWIGGAPVALWAGRAMRIKFASENGPYRFEEESQGMVLALAAVSLAMLAYGFAAAARSAGGIVGGDFTASYGAGISGHFMVFAVALLIFLVGTVTIDRKIAVIAGILLSVMVLGNQTKYLIVVPVLGGLVYRTLSGRLKLTAAKGIVTLLVLYVLFNLAYLIGFTAADPKSLSTSSTYTWILRHFISYSFAGVLGLSEGVHDGILQMHNDPAVVFAPFVNMYAFLTSNDFVGVLSREDYAIDLTGTKHSNVHTLFGTVLIRLGLFRAIVYTLYLGALSYTAYALAILTRNCWFLMLYSMIGAALAIGWFDLVFQNLTFIEIPVYGVLLAIVSHVRGRRRDVSKVAEVSP